MAIKVIKHGQKPKFKKTCPNCGCVFEYEYEDLQVDFDWYLHSYTYPPRKRRNIICPDCGEKIYHDTIIDEINYPTWPNITWTATTNWPDCDKCPNRPDPNKPATVGDTPCTWCPKMRPSCTSTVTYSGGETKATINIPGNYTTEEK